MEIFSVPDLSTRGRVGGPRYGMHDATYSVSSRKEDDSGWQTPLTSTKDTSCSTRLHSNVSSARNENYQPGSGRVVPLFAGEPNVAAVMGADEDEVARVFPRTVALKPDLASRARARGMDQIYEEKSTIPCSDETTRVTVFWGSKRLRLELPSGLSYNYAFNNCRIRSTWHERSKIDPNRVVRRAVLAVESFSQWLYTLAPEVHIYDETDIPRLAKELQTTQALHHDSSKTSVHFKRITEGELAASAPPNIVKALFFDDSRPMDATAALPKLTDEEVKMQLVEKRPTFVERLPDWLKQPMNLFFDTCSSQTCNIDEVYHRTGITRGRLEGMVFGSHIPWGDEPIFPVQIFYVRHGQQMSENRETHDLGPHLTEVGESQSVKAAEFVDKMTEGFNNTVAIWSSRLYRSTETADIIKTYIDNSKRVATKDIPRLYHSLLGEFIPPYPYRFDDDELLYTGGRGTSVSSDGRGRETDSARAERENTVAVVRKELETDAQAMRDGRWLVAAALRGSGILVPTLLTGEAMFPSVHLGSSKAILERCRAPQINKPPVSVGGVYMGHAPSQVPIEERGAVNFIYSGHGNSLRFQIFEEMGFPSHFWRHVQLPHCSVVVGGLLHNGTPSMLVADAGYLGTYLPSTPIPLTYSPCVEGVLFPQQTSSQREYIAHEPFASLLQEQDWFARQACLGVRYNAPPETYFREKNILMVRAGHNKTTNCSDAGLTELGRVQLTAAGDWLGKFLMSGRAVVPPARWCIAGLTSQKSSIDASLRESISVLKAALSLILPADTLDSSLVPDETSLFPENLFAPPETDKELFVVVADDFHLLRYFGACFGIPPPTLAARRLRASDANRARLARVANFRQRVPFAAKPRHASA